MQNGRVVVIGTSAGGLDCLRTIVGGLPPDFPAPVFVVMHLAAHHISVLPQVLSKAGALPALHPEDGETVRAGRIYCAPPDHHLLLEGDAVAVKKGPRENRFRPAIDTLFRSAAYTYGPGAIGIVLSGLLYDGTSGLWTIKRLGGTSIVQDPNDAAFNSMPLSALAEVEIDHCVPVSGIAALLMRLVAGRNRGRSSLTRPEQGRLETEIRIAAGEYPFEAGSTELGAPSRFACPDCHGVLAEIEEGGSFRFRCHTGHAYSAESLLAAVTEASSRLVNDSMRALEEAALLLQKMGEHLNAGREPRRALPFLEKAHETEAKAALLHDALQELQRFARSSAPEMVARER